MPVPPGQPILQLHVSLAEVKPVVWRRLLVPGSVRLAKLHRMLQAAMGWEDYHLHCFEIGGSRFGMQFDEFPEGELHEMEFTVARAVGESTRFSYGGAGGYALLLEVLADPTHDDHEHTVGWVGGAFDPTEFDVGWAKARLERVR
ncbi:MAG TPA: plasmid pRiA4b ORF-3 family protein [Acidimicrobiales bacterium]|jgi:hypothetical protein|nr:plasmid pRiA4b ORF-3 family protein [Acidimicrobiales bacterium]